MIFKTNELEKFFSEELQKILELFFMLLQIGLFVGPTRWNFDGVQVTRRSEQCFRSMVISSSSWRMPCKRFHFLIFFAFCDYLMVTAVLWHSLFFYFPLLIQWNYKNFQNRHTKNMYHFYKKNTVPNSFYDKLWFYYAVTISIEILFKTMGYFVFISPY